MRLVWECREFEGGEPEVGLALSGQVGEEKWPGYEARVAPTK